MMLTRPLNDIRCLSMLIMVALERTRDPEVQAMAREYGSPAAFAAELRSRPQLDDRPGVLPDAPRIPCFPPQRLRPNADDPNCTERTVDFLPVAEILDPDRPRTAATLRVGGLAHTFPVEYTDDGPVPVILDPLDQAPVPVNLTFAAVAQLLGYGTGQPSPTIAPLAWAEQVAAREGVEPRNSRELLSVVERYADVYPGGRQGLASLTGQILQPVAKVGGKVAKVGGKVVKVGGKVAQAGLEEMKKNSSIGQLLRSAIVGYGGPFAVVAIDVVENRLNKRGYTLGSLAESRDVDVFTFK